MPTAIKPKTARKKLVATFSYGNLGGGTIEKCECVMVVRCTKCLFLYGYTLGECVGIYALTHVKGRTNIELSKSLWAGLCLPIGHLLQIFGIVIVFLCHTVGVDGRTIHKVNICLIPTEPNIRPSVDGFAGAALIEIESLNLFLVKNDASCWSHWKATGTYP